MADRSTIEWTEATWNPVRGCSRVSEGCRFCYAERMAMRFSGSGQPYEGLVRKTARGPRWTGRVQLVDHMLELPLRWKKPRTIFVNSMSDLFHDAVPDEFIMAVFETMRQAHWHTFQVLTKRPERLGALSDELPWARNIWMGTSVESVQELWRVDELRRAAADVRFLSLEPLLGSLGSLDLTGIHWVIVGGESGPGSRPMNREWVVEIRDKCLAAGVPFFFKQWGGIQKSRTGRELEGRTWDQLPA